jgi:hypothetical protein
MRSVDRSFDDLFRGIAGVPLQLINEQRTWQPGAHFSILARMALLSAPIRGTLVVVDTEVILDIDLGRLERMLAPTEAQEALASRVRGLLR